MPGSQDKNNNVLIERMTVDFGFLQTMGIPLVQGRYFSNDYGQDLKNAIILNESAVKSLGIADPIGKAIGSKLIIGVVKNFNLHSIHSGIPPLIISVESHNIRKIAVHFRPGKSEMILPFLKDEWMRISSDKPFKFKRIEDVILDIYSSEKNLNSIVLSFTFLTLILAIFGLSGLVLYIARSRTKEIGIRKVYGSSEFSIITSFILNNLIPVLIASIISIPITLYFMNNWLVNFAFKAEISWYIFLISFLISTVFVFLTVFIQTYKVSNINPIEALRYE
jgi:putative ABC transport system permease protein